MDAAMTESTQGAGAFRWNLGGWLGGQLGGTLWILILAVLLSFRDPVSGAIAFACFAVPNAVGWTLWLRRARLRPYPAIQLLVLVEGVCALIAVASLHARDALGLLPEGTRVAPSAMYLALLVFPAVMLQFHLQERHARGAGG